VSDSSPVVPPAAPAAPPDDSAAPTWPLARRPWSAWVELRTDLRAALGLVAAAAVTGVPAGLLWWWLAPRAEFRITAGGPVPVGSPSSELLIAVDAVLALVLAGVGLLAGIVGWRLRRRRGLATLLAVALGTAAAGVIAWQLGQLLAPAPSHAEVTHVGGVVTTGLQLGSPPVLAVGPFVAVLAYLVPAAYATGDDLGRPDPPAALPVPRGTPSDPADAPLGAPPGS
jgi:Protein of unknown function (DUF2567)